MKPQPFGISIGIGVGNWSAAVLAILTLGACSLGTVPPESDRVTSATAPAPGWLPRAKVPAPAAAPATALLSPAQLADFTAQFGDSATLAVVPLDGGAAAATPEAGSTYAWSTVKPLIVARLVADVGGSNGLTSAQRRLISASLANSDNEAAATLHRELVATYGSVEGAAAAMEELLARAGDTQTEVSTVGRSTYSSYGQTLWPAAAQAEFLAALARGCVVDAATTDYLVAAMGDVDPSQSWGLGTIDAVAFKGGWGPDPDGAYLVRQMGIVTAPDGHQYAAAMITHPDSGTFAGGQALANEVAAWVADNVDTAPAAVDC